MTRWQTWLALYESSAIVRKTTKRVLLTTLSPTVKTCFFKQTILVQETTLLIEINSSSEMKDNTGMTFNYETQ